MRIIKIQIEAYRGMNGATGKSQEVIPVSEDLEVVLEINAQFGTIIRVGETLVEMPIEIKR